MKNKDTEIQRFIALALLALLIYSCSGISKATDIFSNPTAKEQYERDYESEALLELWEAEAELALQDSVAVQLPYSEAGKFFPKTFPIYSYEIAANPGEKLTVEVETDTSETLVFIELFKQQNDSLGSFDLVASSEYGENFLQEEINSPGIYKIRMQPEIEANTTFNLKIETSPVYRFPVVSKGNEAIHSVWGDVRDGGRRSHEGIDIFAPRGTPVVATTEGRISRTGNRGLGGKQVWLRDRDRGLSLYYAHLDSIIATPGMSVSPGDTLGLVGNTGNARTTPPHLHFGIYKGYSGAVNPLPFVYQTKEAKEPEIPLEDFQDNLLISTSRANLRTGPSTKFAVMAQLTPQDTVRMLGKTDKWYHIRRKERSSFIHESLVRQL